MEVMIRNYISFPELKETCLGKEKIRINLPSSSRVSDIFQLLNIQDDMVNMVLINGNIVSKQSILMNGDLIEFLPELFGG